MCCQLLQLQLPPTQRCRSTSRTPPPVAAKKVIFFPSATTQRHLGMSYEYHKHPKKNWGQPPAFCLPLADRTGSEKTDVQTDEPYMYICAKGGRGGIYSFPVPFHLFFSRKGAYVEFPFLHLLLQVSLDFEGGVYFAQPPFRSASTFPFFLRVLSPLTTYPREGRRFVGSGTNGDELPRSQSLARWCRSCGVVSTGLEHTQPHLCGGGG